jgi:diacylglycerol kinase family enzyme
MGLPNMELAIMPYGASNDFLRIFGDGKVDLFKDVPSLVNASTITTDIITVGSNYAINGCAVGFTPTVNAQLRDLIANQGKGIGRLTLGLQAFLGRVATVFNKAVVAHSYKVTIDEVDYSGNYSLISVVNGPYYRRAKAVAKEGKPDDGLLDVTLFKSAGPLVTFRSLGRYSRGKTTSNCVRLQAKKVSIKTDKPVWMQMDSELLRYTSIAFEVFPGAVQVVALDNLTYPKA